MSTHIISALYGRKLGSLTRKAVMILFADKASDEGEGIFASKARMAEELDMSRRGLMNTIADLEADGLIRTVGTRPSGTIEYAINLDAVLALPLNVAGIRNAERGERDATPPQRGGTWCQGVARGATKPFFNPSPSEKRAKAPKTEVPDWIPKDNWQAYLDMRKAKKAPPTEKAISIIIGKLERFKNAGHSVATVLDNSTVNCWTDVYEPKPRDRNNNSAGGSFLDDYMERRGEQKRLI